MSKGFFDIFRESFGPREETTSPETIDAEGFTIINLDIKSEAAELAVYAVMNEGALRERDRIVEAFKSVDANWVTFALKELEKIPRSLPRDE
jgi:hypothetical protein